MNWIYFVEEVLSHDKAKDNIWKPFLIYHLGTLLDQKFLEQDTA